MHSVQAVVLLAQAAETLTGAGMPSRAEEMADASLRLLREQVVGNTEDSDGAPPVVGSITGNPEQEEN